MISNTGSSGRTERMRWIRDRAFPVRNAQGEVCRIAGLADDITERKKTLGNAPNAGCHSGEHGGGGGGHR